MNTGVAPARPGHATRMADQHDRQDQDAVREGSPTDVGATIDGAAQQGTAAAGLGGGSDEPDEGFGAADLDPTES